MLDSSLVKHLLSVSGGSKACCPGPVLLGLEVGACGPHPSFSVALAGRAGGGEGAHQAQAPNQREIPAFHLFPPPA